ncbi:hypothetical protein ACSQ67_011224 [Phaseolus vulgaris]
MKEIVENPLHLKSVNHISLVCTSVVKSINFYQNVLGFFPIRRPGSFDFDGAWLFGYGIGIHLLQLEEPNCESMVAVEKKLEEMEMEYVRATVEEGGIKVDQLFFHDPDGFMIEICNCDSLPVIPLGGDMVRSCSRVNLQMLQHRQIHQIVKQDSTKIQNAIV